MNKTPCLLTWFLPLGYRTSEENDEDSQVINDNYDYEKSDINTVDITDFKFSIDLSDHILSQGDIYSIPKDDDDYDIKDVKDTMQVLEEYCKSGSGYKEIEMRKVSHVEGKRNYKFLFAHISS